MTTQSWLSISLVLHITGLAMMVGSTLGDFFIYRRIGKYYVQNRQKALTVMQAGSFYPALIAIGGALLIISGIGMVTILHGVVAQLLWFKVKMGVLALLLINGFAIGGPAAVKLKKLVQDEGGYRDIAGIRSRLAVFYVLQLLLFLLIFILSIFRFN